MAEYVQPMYRTSHVHTMVPECNNGHLCDLLQVNLNPETNTAHCDECNDNFSVEQGLWHCEICSQDFDLKCGEKRS